METILQDELNIRRWKSLPTQSQPSQQEEYKYHTQEGAHKDFFHLIVDAYVLVAIS